MGKISYTNSCRLDAPVAQMDRALDSDISGLSGWDQAQSPAAVGIAVAERRENVPADYDLTTVLKKRFSVHRTVSPYMRP